MYTKWIFDSYSMAVWDKCLKSSVFISNDNFSLFKNGGVCLGSNETKLALETQNSDF